MYTDHLLRHRLLSADELAAEKARLNLLNSGFASQNLGTKAWTLATRDIIDQLNSIAYVERERGYTVITPSRLNPNIGTIDFSGVNDPSSVNAQGHGSIG